MADSKTLVYTDLIQRVGYTIIDNVKVVQHTCTFPINKPQEMRVGSTRLNPELYKANRDICRADMAAFEDAAYELQDEYLTK
jgi:hypothetical protein